MRQISFHNHQRACRVDLRLFRQLARWLLDERLVLPGYELEVSLLGDSAMTRLNEQFVHHAGSTDVITFDYSEARIWNSGKQEKTKPVTPTPSPSCVPAFQLPPSFLSGELFLCPDEALRQARRFRTTWQAELARYFIHGVLHLLGHDDLSAAPRRRMKRAENQLLRAAASQFNLLALERPRGGRP